MNDATRYHISKDIRFGPSTLIDIPAVVDACREPWFNTSLTLVNDCVVRLGIVQGSFHWHSHEREDEMFLVLSGRLLLDLEEGTVELGPHQGWTVPRGVRHRTRAEERTVMIMIERASVEPEGDRAPQ